MTQHEFRSNFLGKARLPCSRLGIGTWAIGGGWGPQPEEQSLEAIQTALELGCGLIDTAPLYGNGRAERLIAQALQRTASTVTTLTKIVPLHYHWAPVAGTPMHTIYPPEHIIAEAEASLQRLQVECLDCLLFQTWCPSWTQERAWYETMLLLQKKGKIRSFGISVSDHRPDEANGVIEAGLIDIIEAPYSLLDQRAASRLFPLALRYQVSIVARTPLASGALAGRWHADMHFHRQDWRRRVFRGGRLQQILDRVAMLQASMDTNVPLTQIALRFCLSHPAVTAVIPGVRHAEHVQCNDAALKQGPLSSELITVLTELWHREFSHDVRTSIGEEGAEEQAGN